MPLYEFNDKETGESVGELHLTIEKMEEFLEMNPNLCVKPGILRFAQCKTAESFPSYPEIDNQTRTSEEKGDDYKPADPASWNDSKPEDYQTGIKITDKRKHKISHFDEDIKKYGKITGAPSFRDSDPHAKIDFDGPVTLDEFELQEKLEDERNPRNKFDKELAGTSKNPIAADQMPDDILMPWEKGFVKQNKERYTQQAYEDQKRYHEDQMETYDNTNTEE